MVLGRSASAWFVWVSIWPLGDPSARRIGAAPAPLAPALLPRGWTKRARAENVSHVQKHRSRGGRMSSPALPQGSPTGLCKEEITGTSALG